MQSYLSLNPVYFIAVFKILVEVTARIGRLQQDFLGQDLGKGRETILLVGSMCTNCKRNRGVWG